MDIKRPGGSWIPAFEQMKQDKSIWVNGYKEINRDGVAVTDLSLERANELKDHWHMLVGNGAYICRPNTPITQEWVLRQAEKLDALLEPLKQHPAQHPRDGEHGLLINGEPTKYPVGWNQILGSIFQDVCYTYIQHIKQEVPTPHFTNYQ